MLSRYPSAALKHRSRLMPTQPSVTKYGKFMTDDAKKRSNNAFSGTVSPFFQQFAACRLFIILLPLGDTAAAKEEAHGGFVGGELGVENLLWRVRNRCTVVIDSGKTVTSLFDCH